MSSLLCMLLPPLIVTSPGPGTDTWGLALLVTGLLCAVRARESRPPWLLAWMAAVLALSFTRDATIILVVAIGWLALRDRSRQMATIVGTGILASLPAPLLFSAPVRDNLAYVFNDYRIPTDTSWSGILHDYPGALASVVRHDLTYPIDAPLPPVTFLFGVMVVAGVVLLFLRSHDDPFLRLMRGAFAGGALIVLISVNYTDMRLELVFVPAVATGLALLGERTQAWLARDPPPDADKPAVPLLPAAEAPAT
jgi:hypothetical protein